MLIQLYVDCCKQLINYIKPLNQNVQSTVIKAIVIYFDNYENVLQVMNNQLMLVISSNN